MSNLATRVQHTETAVSNFKETDTSVLQERLVAVEERVQFNNNSLKEVYVGLDKFDTELKDVEDKLAGWMETEMAKIYDILNNKGNPLGQ